MELTRRQEAFIHKLLDLYREIGDAVHYALVAERLGVSKFTAYDMLRLLEKKGYVTSEYALDPQKSGPGRSTVLFRPTEEAQALLHRLAGDTAKSADWTQIKASVIKKVRQGRLEDPELTEAILDRAPSDIEDEVEYCADVITVLALRLRTRAGRRALAHFLFDVLREGELADPLNLSLVPGLALGLDADEADEPDLMRRLAARVYRYQVLVQAMDTLARRRLAKRLQHILAPLRPAEE